MGRCKTLERTNLVYLFRYPNKHSKKKNAKGLNNNIEDNFFLRAEKKMTAKCLWDTQKLEKLSSGKERVRVLAGAEPQEHRPVWLEWRINVRDEVRVTL